MEIRKLKLLWSLWIWRSDDRASWYILTIKPTTCFGQILCPSSGVFHCTHCNGICHTSLLIACEEDQDGTSWSCLQAVRKNIWHIPLLCVQWKTPDDGQKNCPKHVEFYSKNKFEKLVHLVGFITKNSEVCILITYLLTYLLTYSLHGAESFLRS